MDEARLIENLRLIEALHAGAITEGGKVASERARERILERLRLFEQEDPAVEFQLCNRKALRPRLSTSRNNYPMVPSNR